MELFKNASFCHALNQLSFSLKVIQNIICSFQISLSIYVLDIYMDWALICFILYYNIYVCTYASIIYLKAQFWIFSFNF